MFSSGLASIQLVVIERLGRYVERPRCNACASSIFGEEKWALNCCASASHIEMAYHDPLRFTRSVATPLLATTYQAKHESSPTI